MSREQDKRIKVAVRVRPSFERERYSSKCLRKVDDERVSIINEESTTGQLAQDFRFDYCFDEFDDQRTVYEEAAQEMIDHGLDGCNATIFTYGQTGSGKTWTILGEMGAAGELTAHSGIFLRVFDDLFTYRDRVRGQKHVVLALAAIEIYLDDVKDLLNNKAKVRLREAGDDTLLPGVSSCVCRSMADVKEFFSIANAARSVTATKMNEESSRSHAIFFIDLFQQPTSFADEPPRDDQLFQKDGSPTMLPGLLTSRIALVDLAGSERVKRSGVEGQAMVEAQAINKSLSTLGTVINAMYENSKHIPFRESKLTRILRPSFTDKTSRLLLIGQLAPPSDSFQESSGTLRFCDRVKTMKVANASPFIDPEEEHQFLHSLQRNEELCADVRIARALHFYQPQRPKFRIPAAGLSNLQQFIESVGPNLRAASTGREELLLQQAINDTQRAVFEEMRAELHRREQLHQRLTSELSEVSAALLQAKAEHERESAHSATVVEERLTEAKKMKKKRLQLAEKLEKLQVALAKATNELAAVEQQEAGASRSAKKHSDFDDDADEDAGGGGSGAAVSGSAAGSQADEEREWRQFEHDWRICEANHDIVHCFFTHWHELSAQYGAYVATLRRNEVEWDSIRHLTMMTSSVFNSTIIPDIIEFTIERAVLIAERVIDPRESFAWIDIDGCSKRLIASDAWCPPLVCAYHGPPVPRSSEVEKHLVTTLSDTDDLEQPSGLPSPIVAHTPIVSPQLQQVTSKDAPTASSFTSPKIPATSSNPTTPGMPASAGASATSGAPAGAGADTKAQRRTGKVKTSALTKKHDVAEADKHYLMSVYDSHSLVSDVLKYLTSGTVMLKHGRNGKPHRRKFWVSNISLSRELIWVDPEKYPGSERSAIAIAEIASVTLGQYSKVFKRYPAQTEKEFYLSFTINLKNNSRTLDIVADTLVDFEAWVLGICHLAKVDPHWGKPLDCSADDNVARLSTRERKVLEENHVTPAQYLRIREITEKHRDEVAMHMRLFGNNVEQVYDAMGGIHLPQVNHLGAVLMTKGELRYHCNIFNLDIFRVCKVWTLLSEIKVVYDPGFTPATCFGTSINAS